MKRLLIYTLGFVGVILCLFALSAATTTTTKGKETHVLTQKVKTNQHPGFASLNNDPSLVEWLPDRSTVPASDYLKQTVLQDYLQAWKWYNACLEYNDYRGLQDYFDKEIAQRIIDTKSYPEKKIAQVDLSHHITIEHLSLDYTVVVIQDQVKLLTHMDVDSSTLLQRQVDYNCEVHMTLQDGQWKVFNWTFEPISNSEDIAPEIQKKLQYITKMKGINYYPATSPWLSFWSTFDANVVDRDFARIKKLGLNTVRVFLTTEQMGRGEINTKSVEKFDKLLVLAEKHGLSVLPTLFDFPIGFEMYTYPSYYRQLEFFLSKYRDNTTIIAWNIKNEPDLDFKYHGKDKVMPWLTYMLSEAQDLDPYHPITIGWADPQYAFNFAEDVDYISIHHYRSVDELQEAYNDLSVYNKPIAIEEFGYSSASSIWNLYQHSEDKQTDIVFESISFAEKNNMPWLMWTLYDFEDAPKEVFGWKPWIKSAQKGFGLITTEGKIKPLTKKLRKHLNQ